MTTKAALLRQTWRSATGLDGTDRPDGIPAASVRGMATWQGWCSWTTLCSATIMAGCFTEPRTLIRAPTTSPPQVELEPRPKPVSDTGQPNAALDALDMAPDVDPLEACPEVLDDGPVGISSSLRVSVSSAAGDRSALLLPRARGWLETVHPELLRCPIPGTAAFVLEARARTSRDWDLRVIETPRDLEHRIDEVPRCFERVLARARCRVQTDAASPGPSNADGEDGPVRLRLNIEYR